MGRQQLILEDEDEEDGGLVIQARPRGDGPESKGDINLDVL